jgi:hypothetical protein
MALTSQSAHVPERGILRATLDWIIPVFSVKRCWPADGHQDQLPVHRRGPGAPSDRPPASTGRRPVQRSAGLVVLLTLCCLAPEQERRGPVQYTPPSDANWAPGGFGVGWIVQALPSRAEITCRTGRNFGLEPGHRRHPPIRAAVWRRPGAHGPYAGKPAPYRPVLQVGRRRSGRRRDRRRPEHKLQQPVAREPDAG